MMTFIETNEGIYFTDSLLSCYVCLMFSSLWQIDGWRSVRWGLCLEKWKGDESEEMRWKERRGGKKGICWVSDNLRIRLWSRNRAAARQPLPTSAWRGAAKSFPWKLWPPHPCCLWPLCCRVNDLSPQKQSKFKSNGTEIHDKSVTAQFSVIIIIIFYPPLSEQCLQLGPDTRGVHPLLSSLYLFSFQMECNHQQVN